MLSKAFLGAFLIAIGIISIAMVVAVSSLSWTSAAFGLYAKGQNIAKQKIVFLNNQEKLNVQESAPVIPKETAAWTTYRNEAYSLAFEYPDTWFIFNSGANIHYPFISFATGERDGLVDYAFLYEHEIDVRRLPLQPGTDFREMLIFDAQGMSGTPLPESFDAFKEVSFGEYVFYWLVTERFEGIVSITYYLVSDNDIFSFTARSRNVNWTNPELDVEALESNRILREILYTFRFLN